MYIYYPSCNFRKLFPETAAKIRSYLETQEDVRIAGCCHVTKDAPTENDTIVTICMSCMLGLAEMRPDVKQISLFEFLLTRQDFPWPDLQGELFTVQDCFRARGKHKLHDAVRECLLRMNAVPVEMECNRDEETYDGSFLFHEPYPQNQLEAPVYFTEYLPKHLTILPVEQWQGEFEKHVKLYVTERVICYCNVCTTSAKKGGARVYHLAELIF